MGLAELRPMRRLIAIIATAALAPLLAEAQVVSTLYGVTGDGGTPAETLFILDKTDASSSFVMTLGNGSDGEEIAFNPDDGMLYHASGTGVGRILETIHPGTLAITNIPLSGATLNEVTGLTYEGAGVLVASHRPASSGISTITTGGVGTSIGPTDVALAGLAYVGSTLYAVARDDAELRTIDPLTGATLTTVSITLSGYTVSGANGLATDPEDNSLWALLKTEAASPTDPGDRALAQVDPVTGIATLVGITDVTGMAGIAFQSGEEVTVTASVGTEAGSISPSGPVSTTAGLTLEFTLTPDPGYVIESVGGTCGGSLVGDTFTTSILSVDCTVTANFELEPTTKLYGVTGDGGLPPETLFRLDMADASSTFVLTLGAGNDGEEIAFNRDNGLMYHASGTATGPGADRRFESINLDTLVVTNIPLSGPSYREVAGLTYAGPTTGLLAGERDGGLLRISTAGAVTALGSTTSTFGGLAFIGTTLYAVARNDNLLRTINPATGATTGSVTMTLPGYTLNGATGLANNPDDNVLWAMLKLSGSSDRILATVDPATGIATYIGTTDVPGMAGIAFEFIPCNPCEVTPSIGSGPGTIAPSIVQSVAYGATTPFTLTPDPGHHVSSVGGTCGGSLAGTTFTTAPVYTHCKVIANFAINTYTLTYNAGAGGTISGTTPQVVEHGSNGTQVTAVPNANYHFVSWSDGVLTAARTETNVTANKTVTANFAINTYAVTSSVGTPSGSVSPLGEQQIAHGQTTQFTLTPAVGYHIEPTGGTCGGSRNGSTFTTSAITGPCTVVANFAINTYTLTYNAGTGGTISGTSPQVVQHGSSGTQVTAVPNANYHFVSWSDGVLTAARTDTNVTANKTVTANFALNTYAVTSSVGTPAGTISPLGSQQVTHGQTTQFTVTPSTGYHHAPAGGTCGGSRTGNTYTTSAITAACTVIANFEINSYTLTYNAGATGTISGTTPQVVTHGSSGTQVTAVPNANYHFVSWSDGVLTAARTDTNVTANLTVTANFAINTYTVTSSVGTPSGSISPLGGQQVAHGQTTQFTLTPSTGYHHAATGGTCGGSRNSNTYTTSAITAACTVIANFEINSYTLTYTAGAGGAITGTSPQMVTHGSSGTQVTAVPNANYHFVSWSDGVLTAARTDSNVTANLSVTANFAINTYTLIYNAGAGGSISGTSPQVVNHAASGSQVTAVPDTNYHFVSWSDGVLTAARTDSNVTANLTVTANFAINTYTVTSSVGTPSGSISPLGGQQVAHGQAAQFTLTPAANFHIASVGGSCGGSLVGSTYTTNAITAACAVVANFAINAYTLTYSAGAGGTISGTSPQVIEHGSSGAQVTAVPNANYHFVSWSDGVLTAARTDPNITADLSVTANFAIDTHTVTSSTGTGAGSISPLGGQQVEHGQTTQFTVTPAGGYQIASVDGSCGGSRIGNTYTTNAITADCTVVANFVPGEEVIFTSGFEEATPP
jgi:hypothetical protein